MILLNIQKLSTMNKNLFSVLFIFLLIGFSQTASSCFDGVKGNGNVVKSDRMLSGFDAISVSTGLELLITQDSVEKVVVEADDNLQDLIITEVRGSELRIRAEKSIFYAKARTIHVSVKSINSLSASAGADAKTTSKLVVEDLSVSTSSGADVKLDLNCKNVKADASSGGHMKLVGTAQEIEANASSGAGLNAGDLKCESADADVSSGGDVAVFASEKIRASASSGGGVKVYGDPKQKDVSTSSGGSVNYK